MGAYPQINAPAPGDEFNELDYWTEDDYPVTVRVSFPDNENGAPPQNERGRCRHCEDDLTRNSEDSPWTSRASGEECWDNGSEDESGEAIAVFGPHEVSEDDKAAAELHPSQWLKSARIVVDDDEVTCVVSVRDPRGGFAFTVRRNPDGGFYIHTPYPGESMPHMATEQLHPGTLRTVED